MYERTSGEVRSKLTGFGQQLLGIGLFNSVIGNDEFITTDKFNADHFIIKRDGAVTRADIAVFTQR